MVKKVSSVGKRASHVIIEGRNTIRNSVPKYNHVLCIFSHPSIISWHITNTRSHSLIRAVNGLIKGDPRIVCVLTRWSSSMAWMSSTPDKIRRPESRYGAVLKTTGTQSFSIRSIAFSRLNSLLAPPEITFMREGMKCGRVDGRVEG